MKKSDIAMIVLIATVSVMVSFFAAKSFFGDSYNGTTVVKTIERIDTNIVEPSPEIFNENAINPTVIIQIDNTGNSGSGV